MDNPSYVLKFNEGVLTPIDETPFHIYLKRAVFIITCIIIIGSFLYGRSLFNGLSWGVRILLLALAAKFCFSSKNERLPSPIELKFYDEYLIVYRKKRYYDKKLFRKEYNKFFYKDITKLEYRTETQRISIYGTIEGTWYDYNKDGSLPLEPTYHRTTEGGICYFYVNHAQEIDFVSEIENRSPIKVIMKAN